MSVVIVPKSQLSTSQAKWIGDRLAAPEHADDSGPPKVWNAYQHGLYAVIESESNKPVGLVEASGAKECVSPGWWLDSSFRGKGYGSKLVDALAVYLKAEGYTGVGRITIQTKGAIYDQASRALAKRFRAHFANGGRG